MLMGSEDPVTSYFLLHWVLLTSRKGAETLSPNPLHVIRYVGRELRVQNSDVLVPLANFICWLLVVVGSSYIPRSRAWSKQPPVLSPHVKQPVILDI